MPPDNHSTPASPLPAAATPSVQPKHPWRPDDVRAIAQLVHTTTHIHPEDLFPPSDTPLPPPLASIPHHQLHAAVEQLQKPFDHSIAPFAPDKTLPNYLAVLASEISFLKLHHHQRDAALALLNKARCERNHVHRIRQRLIADNTALTRQLHHERATRTRALDAKTKHDANLDQYRRQLEHDRNHYELLRDNLEHAKLAELDIRRWLDRMRLKIAAMRGEMIIPTVDKLSSRGVPKWLGEFDDSLISGLSDPKNSKHTESTPNSPPNPHVEKHHVEKPHVQMDTIVPTERIESPPRSAKDDLEFDESNEEIEFRLLKNRLTMCEMEAEEWKQCAQSERQKVRLIMRSKARLEEDLARQKHAGGNKAAGSASGRAVSKGAGGSAKATAKLRAAVRASLPSAPDSATRKPIRKNRKGRPRRALVPDVPGVV